MKEVILIERAKDGEFWLRSSSLKNMLIGTGKTLEEAKKDFNSCLEDTIACYDGEDLPSELVDLDFEYKYDTASILEEVSSCISLAGLAKEIGMNASLLRQYKKGQYISPAQAQRIQAGINSIGRRFVAYSIV